MTIYNKETLICDEFIKSPIPENTLIFYSHFSRYWYAAKTLNIQSSDCLVDASCGNGYGTYSIAQKAFHTYGLDINEEYLQMAKNNYNSDNITFITYDKFYRDYPYANINKIISIESYEHIPKDEVTDFYIKLLSKLVNGGSMFITVPLGNNEPSEYNKFHLNEPDLLTIFNLFSPYFEKIDIEIDNFVNSFGHDSQYCFLICKNKRG